MVTMPNHSVPFSGSDWLVGEYLTPGEEYQNAKEKVALQILKELGEFKSVPLTTSSPPGLLHS